MTPIATLNSYGMCERTCNAIEGAGIHSVEMLKDMPPGTLLSFSNIGSTAIDEIECSLDNYKHGRQTHTEMASIVVRCQPEEAKAFRKAALKDGSTLHTWALFALREKAGIR